MSKENLRFKSPNDFAKYFGVSDIEMKLDDEKFSFVEKLKAARIKRGMTQTQLANVLKTKQPAIARMEMGQVSSVSFEFLFKVAFVLGVSFHLKVA